MPTASPSGVIYAGAMALLCAWTGVDFSQYEPDAPIEYIQTNAVRTVLHNATAADPGRRWTLRDVARFVGIGNVIKNVIKGQAPKSGT